ncbi:MAG TPA: hypothetical protein VFQ61_13805 [Polyangiaceae bacterium]|nr:hypothetical protein [Polyangiaceae bacterium]
MKARPAFYAGLVALVAATAHAEPLDPALERLVVDSSCHDASGRWTPGAAGYCTPNNASFKKLVNQLGFAMAPNAFYAARTTGYGGFEVAIEASYTKISSDAEYWRLGTQGKSDPNTRRAATENGSVPGLLSLYSIKLRKGFGFGLELGGQVGFMPGSSLLSGGADVRFAILEGFRRGTLAMFPDVSVGAGVRTITGSSDLQLTVAGLDGRLSKPLPLQDTLVLTPWLGYQHLWIFGDSGLVDLTPGTNALQSCGYAGNNTPINPDPSKSALDGQPVCTATGPNARGDFNNNAVFQHARLERHRLMIGAHLRYEMLLAGAQLATDLTAPADAQSSTSDQNILKDESRQWTIALELGAAF